MINCVKCGTFISDDWSNLSQICGECEADEDIELGRVEQFDTIEELIKELHNSEA